MSKLGKLRSIITVFLLYSPVISYSKSVKIPRFEDESAGKQLLDQNQDEVNVRLDSYNVKGAPNVHEITDYTSPSPADHRSNYQTTQMPLLISSDGSLRKPTHPTSPMHSESDFNEYQQSSLEVPRNQYVSDETSLDKEKSDNSEINKSSPPGNSDFEITTASNSITASTDNYKNEDEEIGLIKESEVPSLTLNTKMNKEDNLPTVKEITDSKLEATSKPNRVKHGKIRFPLPSFLSSAENLEPPSSTSPTTATETSSFDIDIEAHTEKIESTHSIEQKSVLSNADNETNPLQRNNSSIISDVRTSQNDDPNLKARDINVLQNETDAPIYTEKSEKQEIQSATPIDHLTQIPQTINQSSTSKPTLNSASTESPFPTNSSSSSNSSNQITAPGPPSDKTEDSSKTVRQFFADLRAHTVLCLVSLLLLLLAGTVVFSFVLAIFFTLKYCAIGVAKLCKYLKKCFPNRKCSSSGGFQESGSLFPRCDVNIRPYDPNSQADRDMY